MTVKAILSSKGRNVVTTEPAATLEDFTLHLNALQYAYTEETGNTAYKLFLDG